MVCNVRVIRPRGSDRPTDPKKKSKGEWKEKTNRASVLSTRNFEAAQKLNAAFFNGRWLEKRALEHCCVQSSELSKEGLLFRSLRHSIRVYI